MNGTSNRLYKTVKTSLALFESGKNSTTFINALMSQNKANNLKGICDQSFLPMTISMGIKYKPTATMETIWYIKLFTFWNYALKSLKNAEILHAAFNSVIVPFRRLA